MAEGGLIGASGNATLTPIIRAASTQRSAPYERTRLDKIATRPLLLSTNLPARDIWNVGMVVDSLRDMEKPLSMEKNYKCNRETVFCFLGNGHDTDYINTVVKIPFLNAGTPSRLLQLSTNEHFK